MDMDGVLPPPSVPRQSGALRLTHGWSRAVSIGWGSLVVALACTAISSHIIGRPVFWLDDQRWPMGILLMLAIAVAGPSVVAIFWSYANAPHVPLISSFASVILVVAAILDRHASPGAALVEAALACAAVLLSLASFSGRYRSRPQE